MGSGKRRTSLGQAQITCRVQDLRVDGLGFGWEYVRSSATNLTLPKLQTPRREMRRAREESAASAASGGSLLEFCLSTCTGLNKFQVTTSPQLMRRKNMYFSQRTPNSIHTLKQVFQRCVGRVMFLTDFVL